MSDNVCVGRELRAGAGSIKAVLLGTAAAGMIFWAAPAVAQQADEASASASTESTVSAEEAARLKRLGVVTVSARRRDERLQDAPVAITAFSGETMADYNITDVTDLATQVPSMVVGRASSGSSASVFLRGVGSTSLSAGFDQSVSFNLDGLPMSRGREILFSQFDVKRVEVLKGPQALFYGKNTTGGLISVITNGPGDEFEAGGKVGYGFEAEDFYTEGYVSGPISDTFGARLAVRYRDAEGAFENSAAPVYPSPLGFDRRNQGKRGGAETFAGRLTLDWQPTDIFNLELKLGTTQNEDGGATDYLERVCGAGRTTPASANGIPPSPNADCRINGRTDVSSLPKEVANAGYRYARDGRTYSDLESNTAILTAELLLDRLDITSITSHYDFVQTDLNNVSGEAYPASFSQLADFEQVSQELRFQTKFDGPLNFLFGGFYSDADFVFNTDAYIFPVPPDPVTGTFVTFSRDNGFEGQTSSLFVEGTWNFSDQWELSAGARWSREERDSYQESRAANIAFAAAFPGGLRLDDDFEDENVSPQVTLRYQPSTNVSYYVAYKEGFKSGGFNISQTLTPAANKAAGEFDSETAKGFEAGVRSILFDGQLALNATIYDYLYEDLQVQRFDPITVGQVVDNAGELSTTGIEFDFNWLPRSVDGLTIRGAFAYNDADYSDYIGQCYAGQTIAEGCDQVLVGTAFTSQDYNGRTPPKAPETAGRIGATYEFPVFGGWNASVGGDLTYSSEYNYTDTLRPDSIQDAHTKFDATIALSTPDDRWRIALIGRNLTDELIATSANDVPFSGGVGTGTTTGLVSDLSAIVQNPKEIFLEVSTRF
ncbi:TonB-dependent receptor [Henriciella litoralis]|uniref:TonB-dependent receptor n=1 Tax=Henriciella litoralis TaxID=568102 RepID=UPI001F1F70E8|nr:TonB-dependent receptor [Henriciella litoralis]